MGEVVNLNRARKAKDRDEREKTAAENRVRFGRTKAERERERALTDAADRALAGHKLNDGDESDP